MSSFLYFFPPVLILLVLGFILDIPARYVVPYASILAGIVPVGLVRIVHAAVPDHRAGVRHGVEAALTVLAMGALVYSGPPERFRSSRRSAYTQQQQVMGRLMHAVETRVGVQDRVLDCSHNLRVEVALMPRVHESDPAKVRESPDLQRCRRWVFRPPDGPGERWLITGKDHYLAPEAGGRWKLDVAVRLPEAEGYLWRWVGSRPH